MDGWMDKRLVEFLVYGWVNKRLDGLMNKLVDESLCGQLDDG